MNTPPMRPDSTRPTSRWLKPLALAIGVIAVPILLIMLLEAGSSFFLVALALRRGEQGYEIRGHRYAQQDSLLGWVSKPGASVPNIYGPGVDLHIDAQGFRVGRKRDSRAGSGPRAVCSGDSFTLGVGVADDRTWCAMLESVAPGLTTVNMGQNGYGLDQVYLWYKRDGAKLAHDVQLFAYITDDFRRMRYTTAYGSAKPRLEIRNDSLVTTNTPVPPYTANRRRYWVRMVVRNELRLTRLADWVRDSLFRGQGTQPGGTSGNWTAEDSLTWMTMRRVVDDLVQINQAKGSTLVLVHLPVFQEYWTGEADPWRERMRAAAAGGTFVFVDLVEALRRLPADSAHQMFIGFNLPGYTSGFGHFSIAGNTWVAEQLHRRLLDLPSFAAKLGRAHEATP